MNVHTTTDESCCTMHVMDSSGHSTTTWNPSVPAEVEVAEATFDALTEQGYRAFRVVGNDGQGARMEEFDPSARKIMFVPQLKGG